MRVWDRHFTAWQVLRGEVKVSAHGRSCRVTPGQWVLIPPVENERRFSDSARILSLHFRASWISDLPLFEWEGPLVLEAEETRAWLPPTVPMLKLVRRFFPQAYNKLRDQDVSYEQYMALQGNFHRWLGLVWAVLRARGVVSHMPVQGDSRALIMKRWMDAQPMGEPVRMQDLAELVGLSIAQINRIFTQSYGLTPKRYAERLRIDYALAALSTSDSQLKEISFRLGFRHQSEFTAWFKKRRGQTPSEFRSKYT
ncbi:AraC family transcriptional regulator [Ruficoccus amylovorans]|uniref:AraC family transcriptional regulator n=1 Tax=Ruficoccus amylovorans TaxID=1804625 RepID=A0A842H9U8_9BACT|nr:AraC family transcriptional regulator [Ruficoccus amylovorans]MBC2592878.1 AraC family transcriptional regulator [Ruficoccus amylovorans]